MQIWTNSSPDCNLSRTLLPSSTQLRATRQVRRNLLTWVELMGLKPAAHHRPLIHALQETAEGKIDRFAGRLSQSNLRLDIVLVVVSGVTPPATASRARGTCWPPRTPPSWRLASAGGCAELGKKRWLGPRRRARRSPRIVGLPSD